MVQFEVNGAIEVYNLACMRPEAAHTGVNIARWTHEILKQYRISDNQIVVFAADSAANIQKAASLFLAHLQDNRFLTEIAEFAPEETTGDNEDDTELGMNNQIGDPTIETIFEDIEGGEEFDEETQSADLAPDSLTPTSYKVACVVHQLQLAINRWLELPINARVIKAARTLSAKLRNQNISREITKSNLPRAIMDQDTRWSSKHRMTSRLSMLKNFCTESLASGLMKGKF